MSRGRDGRTTLLRRKICCAAYPLERGSSRTTGSAVVRLRAMNWSVLTGNCLASCGCGENAGTLPEWVRQGR